MNYNENHNNFFNRDLDQATTKIISFFLLILIFLVLVLSISMSKSRDRRIDDIRSNVVIESETVQNTPSNPFDEINIEAKSAIVWDIGRGKVIFEREADKKAPLASLTKLVTAAVALENSPNFTTISIDRKSLAAEGDTDLHPGERFNIRDLLKIVLISSSNDGARAIASTIGATLPRNIFAKPTDDEDIEAFVGAMNEFGQKNGLGENNFRNEHGLDISKKEDAGRGSAREIATLLEYLLKNHPDVLEATAESELTVYSNQGTAHQLKNTNRAVNSVPGILASKTGYTDLAGGNVAVITSPGLEGPFAIVVLGSSYDGRFTDLEKLSAATIKYLADKI